MLKTAGKTVPVSNRLPTALYDALLTEAQSRGITISALIRILLTNALKPGTYKK